MPSPRPTPITDALAIDFSTSVQVDWEELGAVVADQNSDDQVEFLLGLAASLDTDEHGNLMQLEHIASAVLARPEVNARSLIHRFLVELAERIAP